jgi:hypothetical protein
MNLVLTIQEDVPCATPMILPTKRDKQGMDTQYKSAHTLE